MNPHWAAVIGSPVRHSLSPRIFRLLRRQLKRDLNYAAITVAPDRLEEAVESAREKPWVGWNVTLPHKEKILPLLDKVDASARSIGAVNVVRFLDGRCIGYNTDAEGFLAPFSIYGYSIQGARAVILGGGGAAKAVCAALRSRDAGEIQVFARRKGNWTAKKLREAVAEADLVVQATPLGMDGRSSPLAEKQVWKAGALAYDLVYRPIETPFLRQARSAGAMTLGGLGMLTAQALATWRIWFGEEVSPQVGLQIQEQLKQALP